MFGWWFWKRQEKTAPVRAGLVAPQRRPHGLHQKYVIQHTDGSPIDDGAVYFVLRLDNKGNNGPHVRASRTAAHAYVNAVNAMPGLRRERYAYDPIVQVCTDLDFLLRELEQHDAR